MPTPIPLRNYENKQAEREFFQGVSPTYDEWLGATWDKQINQLNPIISTLREAQVNDLKSERYGGNRITLEEANKKYGIEGALTFSNNSGMIGENEARFRREMKLNEMRREEVLTRFKPDFAQSVAGFVVGMVGAALDPLNVATAFIPVAKIPMGASLLGRIGSRVATGAIDGLVGAAVTEPFVYSAAKELNYEYDGYDSLSNIASGAAFGAALHVGFGAVGDFLSVRARPEAKSAAFEAALGQTLQGQTVNVEPVFRADTPELRSMDELLMDVTRDRRLLDDLRAGRPVPDDLLETLSALSREDPRITSGILDELRTTKSAAESARVFEESFQARGLADEALTMLRASEEEIKALTGETDIVLAQRKLSQTVMDKKAELADLQDQLEMAADPATRNEIAARMNALAEELTPLDKSYRDLLDNRQLALDLSSETLPGKRADLKRGIYSNQNVLTQFTQELTDIAKARKAIDTLDKSLTEKRLELAEAARKGGDTETLSAELRRMEEKAGAHAEELQQRLDDFAATYQSERLASVQELSASLSGRQVRGMEEIQQAVNQQQSPRAQSVDTEPAWTQMKDTLAEKPVSYDEAAVTKASEPIFQELEQLKAQEVLSESDLAELEMADLEVKNTEARNKGLMQALSCVLRKAP